MAVRLGMGEKLYRNGKMQNPGLSSTCFVKVLNFLLNLQRNGLGEPQKMDKGRCLCRIIQHDRQTEKTTNLALAEQTSKSRLTCF